MTLPIRSWTTLRTLATQAGETGVPASNLFQTLDGPAELSHTPLAVEISIGALTVNGGATGVVFTVWRLLDGVTSKLATFRVASGDFAAPLPQLVWSEGGMLCVTVAFTDGTSPDVSGTINARASNYAGQPQPGGVAEGQATALDISAATVVKATAGRLVRINVVTAGSTTGTANDCATTGAAAAANQTFTIPNTVGSYLVDFPHNTGIVVVPGTSQVLAVSYN